uniref:uncharacterized protein n=1 Tax=Pristiophorus japonicus TaxID=55135 RepID=UPI00398F28A3
MAVGRILLHSVLTATLILTVFGKLPAPQNVKMHSINFKSLLQWNPVTYHKGNVHYSVEYQSYYDNQQKEPFEKGCTKISVTECDLSNELANMVGYYLRVRTEYEDKTSEWADLKEFEPFAETEIGPPLAVVVKPRLDMLDITISEPVNENDNKSMREYFMDLAYKVSYWKVAGEIKIESVNIQQTMTTLTNLKPWTTYCLKVEPVVPNRKTHPSSIVCETTMDNGRVPVWQIIVLLLISILGVFIVTMGIFYASLHGYRTVRYTLFPSYNLPDHIKEYLKQPSLNSQFPLLQTKNLYEESFDKLSIISDIQESFDTTNMEVNPNMEMLEKQPTEEENKAIQKEEEGLQNNNNNNLYGRMQTLPDTAGSDGVKPCWRCLRNILRNVSCKSHGSCREAACRSRGSERGQEEARSMAARLWAFLRAALTLQVFGEIEKPTNIQIHAFNLKYLLKWDDVQRSNYSVNYTVQYRSLFHSEAQQVNHTMNNAIIGNWKDVKGCKNISRTECDFTSTNILFGGRYILRLQAHRGNQTSTWWQTKSFVPYKQNVIGPPSVHVESKGRWLNVNIFDPQMENNISIQKTYTDIAYNISFWKENSNKTGNMTTRTGKLVSLKLEPWTTYCLQVQLFSSTFNRNGQFSPVVCEKTKGTIPLWQIGLVFVVSLVVVVVAVVGCSFCIYCIYKCIKYAFFPPHTLPEHMQEPFSELSQNAPFLVLVSEEDAEECCDQLKVITETESLSSYSGSSVPNTEIEKDDRSGQTSTDSGRFSNEESSKSGGIEESEERTLPELDLHT